MGRSVQKIDSASVGVVVPLLTKGSNISVSTNATGTTFNAFPDTPCLQLTLINSTGFTIEFRQGGAGVAIPLRDGMILPIYGLANANEISVRRADTQNAQIAIFARAEG